MARRFAKVSGLGIYPPLFTSPSEDSFILSFERREENKAYTQCLLGSYSAIVI